ncbi:MAG: Gfo/Idh/MocA family oxidoreductase, partial [Phycisphaeraceae bacterium]
MGKIRIGIVGTGGVAHFHAGAYAQMRGVELTACLDVVPARAEAFAQQYGMKYVVSDLDELIDRVDAVCVTTPDRFHAPVSLKVLKARRHLMCEKPLTTTLAQARRVARAAQQAHDEDGVVHMINFSYRSAPPLAEAKKLIQRGALGELRHVNSRYFQSWLSGHHWGHWSEEKWVWRLQSASGSLGVLGDLGCHILDFTTAVVGDLKAVRCTLKTYPKIDPQGRGVTKLNGKALDANDTALMEMQFANGVVGLCQTTRWATGYSNTVALEVSGTQGALSIDLGESGGSLKLCLGKDRHNPTWKVKQLKPVPSNFQRFIRAIRRGVPDQPDVVRGAQVQAYLD